jgi:ATP-dependent Clp protease ATP-binding subunit ClpC
MDITLKVSPAVRAHIAKAGFDPKYGARPLRRAVQNQVEDALAEEILAGKIKAGDTVSVSCKKGKIVFNCSEKADAFTAEAAKK